jgi:hypothetical protein
VSALWFLGIIGGLAGAHRFHGLALTDNNNEVDDIDSPFDTMNCYHVGARIGGIGYVGTPTIGRTSGEEGHD